MFPHFNQYTSMSPEEIQKDDKRIGRNRLEVLLLGSFLGCLAQPSRAQLSTVNASQANNISVQIERVCDGVEIENKKIILCSSSDSSDDSFDSDSMYENDEPPTSNSVLFDGVDGFLPNVPFNRPHRNPLDERTRELFLSNSDKSNESRTVSGRAKDGSLIKVTAYQVRRKGYHIDVFDHIINLDGRYDLNHVKGLSRPEKAQYVLDPKNLPQDLVHQMQDELLKFFTDQKVIIAAGKIGPNKIEGTVFVLPLWKNGKSLVGFRNYNNSEYRTIVLMSDPQVRRLIATDFHLFPKGVN